MEKTSRFASKPKAPSAISALAWRKHIEDKEFEKTSKAEAIKERKLERQKRKIKKENNPKKVKKGRKLLCGVCQDGLDSDAEDDALKNVGCPQWFHLKCTSLKEIQYEIVQGIDFVCNDCKAKQTENI
ncbi:hypothetical protein FF38_11566 [Lucilia cuprina]|uniref:PHD-type domain-containing protein n=1 Tax=Lucilia cuprina TaxID=7375 RepID=A0A0L0CBA2_LUCCU|nr:hypothetical protein FF38_11566 [Lucilia cuprina]